MMGEHQSIERTGDGRYTLGVGLTPAAAVFRRSRRRYPANAKHSEAGLEWYRFSRRLTVESRPSQCPSTASASFAAAQGCSLRWRSDMMKPAKNTICLWYDGDAEDAARFYAKTCPDSSIGAVHRAPGDFPSGKKGDVLTVEF